MAILGLMDSIQGIIRVTAVGFDVTALTLRLHLGSHVACLGLDGVTAVGFAVTLLSMWLV